MSPYPHNFRLIGKLCTGGLCGPFTLATHVYLLRSGGWTKGNVLLLQ